MASASAIDALLSSGTLDARQRAAAVAYRDVRARFERTRLSFRARPGGACVTEAAWSALKRRHAALIEAAGFERFALDRLCLDDEAPMRCEVGRVREALGRTSDVRPICSHALVERVADVELSDAGI